MVQTQRDPWRTASILLAFLVEYNVILALMHISTAALFNEPIHPTDRVWDFRETHFDTIPGYRTALVSLLTASSLVPVEVFQIARAKLVLDYAMTVQAFHLVFTWLYSGVFPYTWSWWFIWLLSCCIMVFGGEYACMRVELQPISFGTSLVSNTTTRAESQQASTPQGRMSTSSRLGRLSNVAGRDSSDDIELQERDKLMEEGQASTRNSTNL